MGLGEVGPQADRGAVLSCGLVEPPLGLQGQTEGAVDVARARASAGSPCGERPPLGPAPRWPPGPAPGLKCHAQARQVPSVVWAAGPSPEIRRSPRPSHPYPRAAWASSWAVSGRPPGPPSRSGLPPPAGTATPARRQVVVEPDIGGVPPCRCTEQTLGPGWVTLGRRSASRSGLIGPGESRDADFASARNAARRPSLSG